MRILLNLLPTEKKEALASSFHFRFFTWQTVLLLSLEIFYISVLVAIFFLLNYQVQMKEQAHREFELHNSEAKKLTEYQEKFKAANMLSQDVSRYTASHLQWAKLFTLLDTLVPPGVVLSSLGTQDYTVTVNGQAATRNNLLSFQENLKQSDCISDVKVPISNLFSETEIEFQVDFNIKRDCLK